MIVIRPCSGYRKLGRCWQKSTTSVGIFAAEVQQVLLPVAAALLAMNKYEPVISGLLKRRQFEVNLWFTGFGVMA